MSGFESCFSHFQGVSLQNKTNDEEGRVSAIEDFRRTDELNRRRRREEEQLTSLIGTNRISNGAGGQGPMRALDPERPGREKWSLITMT